MAFHYHSWPNPKANRRKKVKTKHHYGHVDGKWIDGKLGKSHALLHNDGNPDRLVQITKIYGPKNLLRPYYNLILYFKYWQRHRTTRII